MANLLVQTLPNLLFLLPASEWEGRYSFVEVQRGGSESGPFTPLHGPNWMPASLSIPASAYYEVQGETLELEVNGTAVSVSFSAPGAAAVLSSLQAAAPWLLTATSELDGSITIATARLGAEAKLLVTGGDAASALSIPAGSQDYGRSPYLPLIAGQPSYAWSDPYSSSSAYYRIRYHSVLGAFSDFAGPFLSSPNVAVSPSSLVTGTIKLSTVEGRPAVGYRVYASNQSYPPDLSGASAIIPGTIVGVADSAGVVNFQLIRGTVVVLRIEGTTYVRRVLVPAAGDTFDLTDSQYSFDEGDPWTVRVPTPRPANIRSV